MQFHATGAGATASLASIITATASPAVGAAADAPPAAAAPSLAGLPTLGTG